MAPEFLALAIIGLTLTLAYGVIYPLLQPKTILRILKLDALITLAVVVLIGYLVDGFDTRFSMIFFETNWIFFTLSIMGLAEWPLFMRFCDRWGLDPFAFNDDDERSD